MTHAHPDASDDDGVGRGRAVTHACPDASDDANKGNRILVEACCEPGSKLAKRTRWSKGCKVVPITKGVDFTSDAGIKLAKSSIRGPRDSLWFSSPCTGGSMWAVLNLLKGPATVKKIQKDWKQMRRLWRAFEQVAEHALDVGARVFVEWPRQCRYWGTPTVRKFLAKHNFVNADFDGCMYGLVAERGKVQGMPIRSLGGLPVHQTAPCRRCSTSVATARTTTLGAPVSTRLQRKATQRRSANLCTSRSVTTLPSLAWRIMGRTRSLVSQKAMKHMAPGAVTLLAPRAQWLLPSALTAVQMPRHRVLLPPAPSSPRVLRWVRVLQNRKARLVRAAKRGSKMGSRTTLFSSPPKRLVHHLRGHLVGVVLMKTGACHVSRRVRACVFLPCLVLR